MALIAEVAILKKHYLPFFSPPGKEGNSREGSASFWLYRTCTGFHEVPTVCLMLLIFKSQESGYNNHFWDVLKIKQLST